MNVNNIVEDQIRMTEWTQIDFCESVEISRKGLKVAVSIYVKPVREKWVWEIRSALSHLLTCGTENTAARAKLAGEAAAKRLFLTFSI